MELPSWLLATTSADINSPWQSREQFYAEIDSPRTQQLRNLLEDTQREQAEFIVLRLGASIDKILAAAPTEQRTDLRHRIERLANENKPAGLYALIDYLHFKGSGLVEAERYQGSGWGLLQVLQGIDDEKAPLEGFVESAQLTLERRVNNAPSERREERWLQGWTNRLNTYLVN